MNYFLKFTFIICQIGHLPSMATDYYIRPSVGNDSNAGTGTTATTAWKTLSPVNTKFFFAGDKLFLEGSFSYEGSINFDSRDIGAVANPILITSFGVGKAVVNSGNNYGFAAFNTSGISISNIDFKGSGTSTNGSHGIQIYSDLPSTLLEGIFLENIEVSGYLKSGISIGLSNSSSKGFSNVKITHCISHDNGETGISSYGLYTTPGVLPHSNFYLGYNKVYNNSGRPEVTTTHTGSGIILAAVDGGIIEHCIAYNNGALNGQSCGGPVAIWCYDSNNITIQYCEAYNNKAGKSCDGGGFDIDGGVTNSTIQYNYSHNNEGAGYLIAQYKGALPLKNNTIRYNISENDGRKNSYGGIYLWSSGSNGGIQNTHIYNNTIYISPASSGGVPSGIFVDGLLSNVSIRNNIFQSAGGVVLVKAKVTSGITFQGNCYWSTGGTFKIQWGGATYNSLNDFRSLGKQEKNGNVNTGFMADPKLTSPGNGGTIGNTDQLATLNAYLLKSSSPLINSGLHLKNTFAIDPGTRDFYGNTIPQNTTYDIGANEYMGTISNCISTGSLGREVWTGIIGNEIKDIPVNNPANSMSYIELFEGPSNTGMVNYGSRIRGYICAPLSGNYIFWIASNDKSELWLSTNEDRTSKIKIAYVSAYTNGRQWNKYPSQKSGLIHLQSGKRYYIEALHKQGGGTDNIAVGWQLPDGAIERPIPGNRVSPYEEKNNIPPTIRISNPLQDANFTAPATITINTETEDSDGTVVKVEFYNGTLKLGEDQTFPFAFVWNHVPVGNYSIIAKAIDNREAVSISSSVNIRVIETGTCTSSGSITREYWEGISGNNVSDIPIHISPTTTTSITLFEGPSNVGTNYGARIRGYICAPHTGNYIFWISSNDHSELWLSTDENTTNKVKIAFVNGSTGIRQWDKYLSQKSMSISLVAGNTYYIEALHKQGAGSDNIAVGWQLPDGSIERPIPGRVLSSYQLSSSMKDLTITLHPVRDMEHDEKTMDVKVFPNPVHKGKISLTIAGYENTKHEVYIEILRTSGEVVYSENTTCDTNCKRTIVSIDETMPAGNYIINVIISDNKYSERLMVY